MNISFFYFSSIVVLSSTLIACVNVQLPQIALSSTPSHTTLPDITVSKTSNTTPQTLNADAVEILNLVNQARATARNCGSQHYPAVAPLKWNQQLYSASKLHSEDMATQNYFSHQSKDGRTMAQRVKNAGYKGQGYFAENIAVGNADAKSTIEQWLKSPKHCANLMNAMYVDVGMAHAYSASSQWKHYWTMKLAK